MKVVALGGGHGLAASLSALRHVADDLTAVVTVADNGGSSGRIRREFGTLPPGDLRMALAALCGDDDWGRTWARVLQHRFDSEGEMHGHAVGNLLIVALWELLREDGGGEQVAGLAWVGRLLGAQGRVLPMALSPLDITARVVGADPDHPEAEVSVRGQVEVATTPGRVVDVALEPPDAVACPEAVTAIREADWVVIGPGSWYSSVIPHLLVPDLCRALHESSARRLVNLNLVPQPGETDGLSPVDHLDALVAHAPGLRLDVVLGDSGTVAPGWAVDRLRVAAARYGGRLELTDLALASAPDQHDPERLRAAYERILG
ncbi:uridine diphosphate-N-acetylglucosamine-binding protein YvcK [Nocardioides mangrovicus]|uniref:Putative gluconeogenesis factor n=1 Tax=Nocardioides mangrovicus TaxID=2478913 RepID=A0A3L8P226_9ACTN|nr:uridine diphosphate-N-acetylglucosamine-binding protein YvcK [Nocardioides mangrovicus]RLV49345.1 uridine diphosphate-N-acetylglucosamine-binding protein YvcK [Nocardioides mangrovicus]